MVGPSTIIASDPWHELIHFFFFFCVMLRKKRIVSDRKSKRNINDRKSASKPIYRNELINFNKLPILYKKKMCLLCQQTINFIRIVLFSNNPRNWIVYIKYNNLFNGLNSGEKRPRLHIKIKKDKKEIVPKNTNKWELVDSGIPDCLSTADARADHDPHDIKNHQIFIGFMSDCASEMMMSIYFAHFGWVSFRRETGDLF